MLKGKADGLGMVYSENSSGQIIQIGQHLGQNKIYKTPFIQSSVKSHGMGDNFIGLNGHAISEIEGNMIQQPSMKQNSHGIFNSSGKAQQLAAVHESV